MKTYRKITTVALVLILSVLISGFINPQKKIKLKLNLEENKSYKIETVTEQEIIQDIMGMEQKVNQNHTIGYDYNVLEKTSEGNMRIKVSYTHVKFFQEMPMGTTEYDSEKDKDNVPDAAKAYAAIIGESFEILITPMGKINEIKGVDEMINNVLTKIGGEGNVDDQIKQTIDAQFGDEAIKSSIENLMAIYPIKAVKKGNTWTKENLIKTMFSMKVNYTYELIESKNNTADIKVTSTIKTAEGQEEMEISGMKMKFNLEGDQSGELHVDIKTGLVKDSEITQNVKGNITMNFQGEDMTIPMKIKSVSKTKLLN